MKEKILNDRFKLQQVYNKHFLMYLDGKLIGENFNEEYGYNSYSSEKNHRVFCNFSEISNLSINKLPSEIEFVFVDFIDDKVDCKDAQINDIITFDDIECKNNKVFLNFFFKIDFRELLEEKINPILLFEKLRHSFNGIKYFNTKTYNDSDDLIRYLNVNYEVNSEESLSDISSQVINKLLIILENSIISLNDHNDHEFNAIFNLPKEYQSILKPYLQYFEEFLNDLCIESDVNIQRIGEDTILSVEPKNKDEALEKIADALKAYLCAPVMVESVSLEQTLQMQTELSKLYAQCKNLESQMIYKEITLKEQNKQLELNDNIINESKRVLVDTGVDTNIITQSNTILLESLKLIKIKNKETDKKTFLGSIKAKINVPEIFNGSLELKRDKY